MSLMGRGFLPEGVDEHLPPAAWRLEELRRRALDLFDTWGYQLCAPPLLEYLESLLSGVGEDLELQTFKFIDQLSGRLLGVPADTTPQIVRIDALRLPTDGPQRLCYAGPILHTRPEKFAGSRNPLQIGAELYGHAGIDADVEVQALLLALCECLNIDDVTLELSHMGLYRGLSRAASLATVADAELLDALLRKDRTEVERVLAAAAVPRHFAIMFCALLSLHGERDVLARARRDLAAAPPDVVAAVASLEDVVDGIARLRPNARVHLDLAELRGYHYHTGLMFAAYTAGFGRAIAWGGRYDNVGAYFGRPRPATGFSTDLKLLSAISRQNAERPPAIVAPVGSGADLLGAIAALRARGEQVVQALPGETPTSGVAPSRRLECVNGVWQVVDAASR